MITPLLIPIHVALVTSTLLLSVGNSKTTHPSVFTFDPFGVLGQLSLSFKIPSSSKSLLVIVISITPAALKTVPSFALKIIESVPK